MNGVSLLVAMATLGIDVGWEAGPHGQLVYTIRIEKLLIEPLREGKAVESAVDLNDRGLRRFQITMESRDSRRVATSDSGSRSETMVQYGWRPGDGGGLDYLVQISPERLETLAKGIPILGEVSAEVAEVRRFYIFVGVGQLPREGLPQDLATERQPPPYLRSNESSLPAAAREREPLSRSGASGRWSRFTESDFRRGENDVLNISDVQGSRTGSEQGGTSLAIPRVEDRPAGYRFGERVASHAQTEGAAAAGEQLETFPHHASARASGSPATVDTAARPDTTRVQPLTAARDGWQQGPLVPPIPTASMQQTTSTASSADEPVRPWTPLILTTLALFASLGANAFLGWIAWSFFWRYRQAAADLARPRAASSGSRQAA